MKQKKYDVLLFDVDDTLLDFAAAEAIALRAVFHWLDRPLPQEVLPLYSGINEALWLQMERGECGGDEVLTLRFDRLFEQLGMTVDSGEANAVFQQSLAQSAHLVPGALETCRELAPEFDLYVASNGVQETQQLRIQAAGLQPFFKGAFVSQAVGHSKPERAFFEAVFRHLPQVPLHRILMVGNSLTSDIQGGVNAGIDTCWFNPHGLAHTGGAVPTYTIAALSQLRALLWMAA